MLYHSKEYLFHEKPSPHNWGIRTLPLLRLPAGYLPSYHSHSLFPYPFLYQFLAPVQQGPYHLLWAYFTSFTYPQESPQVLQLPKLHVGQLSPDEPLLKNAEKSLLGLPV
jgi:hypothetical protein